ncbi:MAG: 6-carboxytetrahydropterin synthase, partial [Caldisericia bacterium]|nr:6-carboxytetrahydropterin synthase [Caldisericia bacterium]
IFDHLVREQILCHLDHQDLNVQFPNPSTEMIAQWIYNKMEVSCRPNPYQLYEVSLSESSTSHIIIRKDV